MGHKQKGKRMKRRKSWHRGGVEAKKYLRSASSLAGADVSAIDYSQALPEPINSHTTKAKRRGK